MPADPSLVSGLTGRYALALFDLGEEGQCLDRLEADLAALRTAAAQSDDLGRALTSPMIDRATMEKALMAVAAKLDMSDLARKFLGTLARNRRLNVLDRIISDFNALLAASRGQITAKITSARALNDAQRAALSDKLKTAMGRDVSLNEVVSEDLIGGLIVQIGSRQIDASLKTKLDQVEQAMKGI